MRILVPCKLGDKFTAYKFKDWINGKRAYVKEKECIFYGFSKFICTTPCLGTPMIYAKQFDCSEEKISGIYEYDAMKGYKDFVPAYEIEIPDYMFEEGILSQKGFDSNRKGHLSGLKMKDGIVLADIIVPPTYEHIELEYPKEIEYITLEQIPHMYMMFRFNFAGSHMCEVENVYQ